MSDHFEPFAGLMNPLRDRPAILRRKEPRKKPEKRAQRTPTWPKEDPWWLTPAERRLMPMIVEGMSAKEIAALLDLSHRTVEVLVARLRKRMDARSNVVAAVLWDRWTRSNA